MKYLVCNILLLILIARCNVSDNKSPESKIIDAHVSKQNIVTIFNEDEKAAMDSLRKYQLDSVYLSCIKFLYVIYGNEFLFDNNASNGLTIGECNIRIVGFKNKLGNAKELTFGVFVNDSIPTDVIIKTTMGHMINGFEVDVKKRKILNGKIGELGKIDISNIQELYNNAVRSKLFNDYIIKNKERLHPKFIKLLDSISKK